MIRQFPPAVADLARRFLFARGLRASIPCLFTCLALTWLASPAGTAHAMADPVDFRRDVQPILSKHCVRCHRAGNAKGDVSLETSTDVLENQYVVPGSPDDSELLHLVRATDDESPQMPKEGGPLSDDQLDVLTKWIRQGADWPKDAIVTETPRADRSWWSLQPIGSSAPPEVADAPDSWQNHPIDRFVLARMHARDLQPSPPADRRTLIRRATYDLTGLPPTPAELDRFLTDPATDAYERLIDRLLASPAYGERWGRHWLDVIRFGESRGFERNEVINNLWPFRDYIVASFNADKPFDQMVREHLAGDVLGENDPNVEIGTAFLVCGPYDDVGNQDPVQAAQIRANTIDEVIRTTTETFLGLTVGCARCHNHKFDPILQQDYYALYATFAGVHHGSRTVATLQQRETLSAALEPLKASKAEIDRRRQALDREIDEQADSVGARIDAQASRPPVDRRSTREEFEAIEARLVRLVVSGSEGNPAAAHGYTIDEFEVWSADEPKRNVALSRRGGTAEGASRVANDFADAYSPSLTIDGRFGARWLAAGPSLTIRLARPTRVNAVVFSSDRKGDAGDHGVANFVADYQVFVSLDGERWRKVADSSDRRPVNAAHRQHRRRKAVITEPQQQQLAEIQHQAAMIQAQINAIPPLDEWWVGQFRDAPGPFHVFLGGDPQRPGDAVMPASLSVLSDVSGYRLDANQPESVRRRQLAEWIVHPDNPLPARVLANRLWHYHFAAGIVSTPSDFGSMGQPPTHPQLLDYLARQLRRHRWHLKPLHRMIMLSQTYRQASDYRGLAARTDSDARLLWRFPPRRLSAEEIRDSMLSVAGQLNREMYGPGFRLYRYLQDNVATYIPLDQHGPETYRRAIYHQNSRAARIDLMTEFDCPDNSFAVPSRASTTTPLQALAMLNHSFCLDMAEAFAKRLEAPTATVSRQVQDAYELVCARSPTADEVTAAAKLIDEYGLRAFCRALLNSNEFLYLD